MVDQAGMIPPPGPSPKAIGSKGQCPGGGMTPQDYCRRVCKKSGSNFVFSFYLFGRRRRQALEAFYAFCRKVDDAVDLAETPDKAIRQIAFWKEEVGRLANGIPEHPVGLALKPLVEAYDIPLQYLQEIVAGCEMDVTKKSYETFAELETYCYRVASCVGLVCLRLFGVSPTHPAEQAAMALGKALQLTNILRDIVTDLRRERIYIPREDLDRFSIRPADLANPDPANLNLFDLLYFEIERATGFYQAAWNLFPKRGKERRRLAAAFSMGRSYETLLDKIAQNPLRVFEEKVCLSGLEKLKIAGQEVMRLIF